MFITNYLNFAFTKDKNPVLGLQNRFLKIFVILLFTIPAYLYIKKLQETPIIIGITVLITLLLFILCIMSMNIFLYQRKMHKTIYDEWYSSFGLPDDPKINQISNKKVKVKETKSKLNSDEATVETIVNNAKEERKVQRQLAKEDKKSRANTKKKPKLTRAEKKAAADRRKAEAAKKRIDKKNNRGKNKKTNSKDITREQPDNKVNALKKPIKPQKPVRKK